MRWRAAAARAGLPYTLSTLSTRSIEEVAAVSEGSKWFQVYVWRDRGLVKEMVDRAAGAGYEALMLTVDTAVFGKRERDVRRGFTLPPKIGLRTLLDGAIHPGWTWQFVRCRADQVRERVGLDVGDGSDAVTLADYINAQFDPSLSWTDVEWLRSIWSGPIVVKGVQTVEDATIASNSVSTRSRCRTTAAASSTVRRPPSTSLRRSRCRRRRARRSSVTVASAAGATS